jgi:hypothetical protein
MNLSDIGGGGIKSIQRGSTVGTNSVTITAVDPAKTIVLSGFVWSDGANGVSGSGTASLQNSTTLQVVVGSNGADVVTVFWQVVEYK